MLYFVVAKKPPQSNGLSLHMLKDQADACGFEKLHYGIIKSWKNTSFLRYVNVKKNAGENNATQPRVLGCDTWFIYLFCITKGENTDYSVCSSLLGKTSRTATLAKVHSCPPSQNWFPNHFFQCFLNGFLMGISENPTKVTLVLLESQRTDGFPGRKKTERNQRVY